MIQLANKSHVFSLFDINGQICRCAVTSSEGAQTVFKVHRNEYGEVQFVVDLSYLKTILISS